MEKMMIGPENLDRFRRMLVYRGAGLGRFHCITLKFNESNIISLISCNNNILTLRCIRFI